MTDAALLTPAEVARRLRVEERTVQAWLRQGRLKGVKLGRLWRVAEGQLDRFLAGPVNGAYDVPLTAKEEAESDAAWRDYLAGIDPGARLDIVRQELLVSRSD